MSLQTCLVAKIPLNQPHHESLVCIDSNIVGSDKIVTYMALCIRNAHDNQWGCSVGIQYAYAFIIRT
jgi:hypothetical protein